MTELINQETIKQLAKQLRAQGESVGIPDLIALHRTNDPFYTGTPAERAKASFFAGIWERFGYGRGVHLRRIHYQLIGQDVEKHNGEIYQNTDSDWNYLCDAGQYARYLGLVNAGDFVDRRNPETLNAAAPIHPDPFWGINTGENWEGLPRPRLPSFFFDGYEGDLQPYHLEIWIEKSTMDDILLPICRRYKAVLVRGLGEMSITAVIDFLERVREAGKPARIFYISDYDPAGWGMPKSVARKIEFYNRREYGLDIKLYPIALSPEQVKEHRLPRTPIKDSEKRKDNFENAFGEGAVELDALEALHPGVLADIVTGELDHYFDREIGGQRQEVETALADSLELLQETAWADLGPDLQEFEDTYQEAAEMCGVVQEAYNHLREKMLSALQGIPEEEVNELLEAHAVPLGMRVRDPENPLLNSDLDYWEQLKEYKARDW